MAISCLCLGGRIWEESELELEEPESLSKLLFFVNLGILVGGLLSLSSSSDDEYLLEAELSEVEDDVVELELDWYSSLPVASNELFCRSRASSRGVGWLEITILVIRGESR